VSPVSEPEASPTTDLDSYPTLQRMEPLLSQDRAAEDFELALESLLDRIDLLLPPRRRGEPTATR
jgi:hypothetical protein